VISGGVKHGRPDVFALKYLEKTKDGTSRGISIVTFMGVIECCMGRGMEPDIEDDREHAQWAGESRMG